ncbi:HEAT repeat domain-containing protein [Intrasporangium calvum]|uniref:PBS lyase HEAT domain protein repeat-containing protein n=1 Tax=Intrasporangium calvum (strain ATCC 23552 / DSM 43043 / JCM 3097 / NBRC 12989 / NCIMB 10167 / NRRL B-3866 / 7 KIP) TaxID=710696 RepID=E6SA99_INTC7|nr:PBS lyase HEAT domain-containing protein repeat-containing protein [Intrasporangium calvum]ADU49347.1 PBS lyase HEAT domain protein repeat-containing protein [Intrasporangium calvum DSM 43043]
MISKSNKDEFQEFLHSPRMQRFREQDPSMSRARALYLEAGADLLASLRAAGYKLDSVGDLRNSSKPYRDAIPILIEALHGITYLPLVEDVLRTLAVKFAARQVAPLFLKLFREPPAHLVDPTAGPDADPPQERIRWVIGNGLGILANPAISDELIELALDVKYGRARARIVWGLPRTRHPRVPSVLMSLLNDREISIVGYAIEGLGKLGHVPARDFIASKLSDQAEHVQSEARKALKQIDRVVQQR